MRHFAVLAFLAPALLAAGAKPAGATDPRPQLPKILWRQPGTMTLQDWVCGPGGCEREPAPPFRFLRLDLQGSAPKVSVRDARGRTWSVKLGAEVIPEVFAPRFLMALGYFAEPAYYVPSGTIMGVPRLPAKIRHVLHEDGSFTKARFELRDEKYFVFLPNQKWAWNANPFLGTPQLAGLKIVMMLLSNWDAKDARNGAESNNAAFRWADSGHPAEAYAVFDWGAALGRWGGFLGRSQSDCVAFAAQTPDFVQGLRNGVIQWGFSGKHASDVKSDITPADVRWLLPYLKRITPDSLRAGLAASGATPRQAGCWASSIEDRTGQLEAVAEEGAQGRFASSRAVKTGSAE